MCTGNRFINCFCLKFYCVFLNYKNQFLNDFLVASKINNEFIRKNNYLHRIKDPRVLILHQHPSDKLSCVNFILEITSLFSSFIIQGNTGTVKGSQIIRHTNVIIRLAMSERCQTKLSEKFDNKNYIIYFGILCTSIAVLYFYR